jgi:hypothetical protein
LQDVPSSAFDQLDTEVAGLQIWQVLAGLAALLAYEVPPITQPVGGTSGPSSGPYGRSGATSNSCDFWSRPTSGADIGLSAVVSGGEIGASGEASLPISLATAKSGAFEMSGDGAWSIAAGVSAFVEGPSLGGRRPSMLARPSVLSALTSAGPQLTTSVLTRPSVLPALSATMVASDRPASVGFWHLPGNPGCAPMHT